MGLYITKGYNRLKNINNNINNRVIIGVSYGGAKLG